MVMQTTQEMYNVSDIDFARSNDTRNSYQWIYQFVGLTELLVAIFGTPMNIMVLLAASSRRKGTTLKSRRTITECLVISMSTADLIFCVFHAPLGFVYFYMGAKLTTMPCWFFYTTTHVSTIASSLSLLGLNVNKFLQLHRPLHYYLYMTKSRALAFIAAGWSISIGWGAFFVFGPFIKYDECNATLRYPELYVFFATEFFVLPTVVSLFVSVDIAVVVLNEQRRRFREMLIRSRNRNPRGSDVQVNESSQQQMVTSRQKPKNARDPGNIRRITFVFATTIWSFLTVIPYRFCYIIHYLPGYQPTETGIVIAFCLFALMAINAAGNPLITLLTHKQYSNQIYDWIRCPRKPKS